MKRGILMAVIVGAALAAGCANTHRVSTTPPWPVDRVDYIDVWATPPAAINWDDVPGPDGVRLNVFLYQANRAEPVMGKGTLEFTMYEGHQKSDAMAAAKPLRTWTFTTQELATRQVRTMAGWGYAIQLGWGRDVPKSAGVTFVARYLPAQGTPTASAPIMIGVPQ